MSPTESELAWISDSDPLAGYESESEGEKFWQVQSPYRVHLSVKRAKINESTFDGTGKMAPIALLEEAHEMLQGDSMSLRLDTPHTTVSPRHILRTLTMSMCLLILMCAIRYEREGGRAFFLSPCTLKPNPRKWSRERRVSAHRSCRSVGIFPARFLIRQRYWTYRRSSADWACWCWRSLTW